MLFNFNNPKHIGIGLFEGIKNITKGALAGITSSIFIPYLHIKNNKNNLRYLEGLGLGLGSLLCLPIFGIFSGSYQVIKGVVNTPTAIYGSLNGKIWDEYDKKWFFFNSIEENNSIKNLSEIDMIKKYSLIKLPKENYYSILGINIDSSNKNIKKAYYKLAKQYHPDKNNSNDDNKFKEITEAYKILSDPKLRNEYNIYGKEQNIIKNIYNNYFQKDEMLFYTQDIIQIFNFKLLKDIPLKYIKFIKKKRILILVNNLSILIEKYINNDEDKYTFYLDKKNKIKNENNKILFKLISSLYIESGLIKLNIKKSFTIKIEKFKRKILNNFNLFKSKITLFSAKNKKNALEDKNLYIFILNLIILDLEILIKEVCYRFLNDTVYSKDLLTKRAKGLIYIGNIFLDDNF